jgi:ectoine hydroxylase-related dioxygenase (phytanoyl-CoA dioxygenase family)
MLALAKQDIAEDDHIIQFGDDFGDQVCASFIKTHGFNDLFNLLKEVDNSVLEENKQYADVEPQPVEHGDASSSKGFFSSISNWWHGVVDSF